MSARFNDAAERLNEAAGKKVADIYNRAGDHYAAYADGDPTQLFAFDGMHAYADRCVWALLEKKLVELKATGATAVSFLDAGCGPGTWLRRLVVRARALGFTHISRARLRHRGGADRAGPAAGPGPIKPSRRADHVRRRGPFGPVARSRRFSRYSLVPLQRPQPFAHCEPAGHRQGDGAGHAGHFITTVRSVGSPPTAFVELIENVRQLKQDHVQDRCEIELSGGRHISFNFHLFTAGELRGYFANDFDVEDMRGLDLFHSRFLPDPRWSPGPICRTACPMSWCNWRRLMPPIAPSWIVPPISCWLSAARALRS